MPGKDELLGSPEWMSKPRRGVKSRQSGLLSGHSWQEAQEKLVVSVKFQMGVESGLHRSPRNPRVQILFAGRKSDKVSSTT